ncbi:zinc finger BED domain-containing protein DAYSLEEPER-like isoform X2 [Nicotiana tabacum]|uniref:Zinc finger BED domain-containing protein DAYSLEEPER-like isoform X2 n=3 Tax=Nicotiana tabacum TaxID=4097 RepID=A0AC58T737_TOBAC
MRCMAHIVNLIVKDGLKESEDRENERPDFDILALWKVNSPRFPILSKMARNVLAIPISSVAYESVFSTEGRILDQFRSSLTPKLVETLVCLQDWLRSESLPVNVEEDLDFLETLEEDFTNLGKEASTDDVC